MIYGRLYASSTSGPPGVWNTDEVMCSNVLRDDLYIFYCYADMYAYHISHRPRLEHQPMHHGWMTRT